jgi:hypothetical protein
MHIARNLGIKYDRASIGVTYPSREMGCPSPIRTCEAYNVFSAFTVLIDTNNKIVRNVYPKEQRSNTINPKLSCPPMYIIESEVLGFVLASHNGYTN